MSKSNKKQEVVTNNTAKAAKADLTSTEVAINCLVEQLKVLQEDGFGMSKPAKKLRNADLSLLDAISSYIKCSIPRCKEVDDQILFVKTSAVLSREGDFIKIIGEEVKSAVAEHQIKIMVRDFAILCRSTMPTGKARTNAVKHEGMPYTKEQGEALVEVIWGHFYEGAQLGCGGGNEGVNYDLVLLSEIVHHSLVPALIGPTLTRIPFNMLRSGAARIVDKLCATEAFTQKADWCAYIKAHQICCDLFDSEELRTLDNLLNAEKTEAKTEEDSGSNGAAVVTNKESGQEPVKGSDMNASKKSENVTKNQSATEAAATLEVANRPGPVVSLVDNREVFESTVADNKILLTGREFQIVEAGVNERPLEALNEILSEAKAEKHLEAKAIEEVVEKAPVAPKDEAKEAPIEWSEVRGVRLTRLVAQQFVQSVHAGKLKASDTYIKGVKKHRSVNGMAELQKLLRTADKVKIVPGSAVAEMILISRLIVENGKAYGGRANGCFSHNEIKLWTNMAVLLLSPLEQKAPSLTLEQKEFNSLYASNRPLLEGFTEAAMACKGSKAPANELNKLIEKLKAESAQPQKESTSSATNNATTGETPNNETANEQSKEKEVKEPKTTVMAGLTGWMTDVVSIPSDLTHKWSVRSSYTPAASEKEAKAVMELLMSASSITGKESAIKEELPADVGSLFRAGMLSLKDTVGKGSTPGIQAKGKIAAMQGLVAASLVLNARRANISLLGGDIDRAFASVNNDDVKAVLEEISSAADKSSMPLEYYVLGLKKDIAVLEETNGCKDKIQTYKSAVKAILDSGTTRVRISPQGLCTTLRARDEVKNLVNETLGGLFLAKSTGEDKQTHDIVPSNLQEGLVRDVINHALSSILSGEDKNLYWVMQATNASRVKNLSDGAVYTVAVGAHLVTVGATETINYMVGLTGHSIDTVVQSLIWSWVRMTQGAEAAEAQGGTLKQVAGNLIEIAAAPFVIAESFGASLQPKGMWERICNHYSPKDEAGQPTESKTKRAVMFIPRTVTGAFKVAVGAVSWTARNLWSGAKKACSWIGGLFSKKTETKAASVATS
jgi:hypothetical protein